MNQNLDPKQNPEQASASNADAPEMNNDETKATGVEQETAAEGAVAEDSNTTNDQTVPAAADTAPDTDAPMGAGQGEASEEKAGGMTGYIVGAIVLALLMIGGVWYFVSGTNVTDQPTANGTDTTGPTAASILGLDEGDPTDPIVEVNGEVLDRSAYNRLRQQLAGQAQQQGMDLNSTSTVEQIDNQALETLINTELIRQAAVDAGREVDDAEVDARFTEIVDQVGGADALASTLEESGLTEASLRADVEQELLVQGYLDAQLETEDFAATDEEVNTLYDEAGGADAGLPPLEEVRPQVEQQIEANKRQEATGAIVDALRESAEVEVLI